MDKIRSATTEETVSREVAAQESSEASDMRERTFRTAPKLDKSPLHGLWALTNRDLKKWYKSPIQLFMTLIQPIIWLGLFGKALNFGSMFSGGSSAAATAAMENIFGTSDYFSFLAAGMLAFVILFTAMFSGMSIVWDRRFGFLNKLLSTPVGRGSVVMGKVLSSVFKSLAQAAIVLVIAVVLGMSTAHLTIAGIAGTFAIMFLMALGLSSLFVMLALRSTDWQTQMAIMNLLNLPLLFASNALFPAKLMPTWLQYVVKVNPVSYATDAARQLLLSATGMNTLALDFGYLIGFAALFSAVGIVLSWRYLSK